MNINNILKRRAIILDGACGTSLHGMGMPAGVLPELWCLENPGILSKLHKNYIDAGSDIIYSATFGANRVKIEDKKVNIVALNKRLALIAKDAAASSKVLVAGDISSTGRFVKPFGELDFNEAVDIFKEQVKGLLKAEVDLFVIETMMDIQEARAALLAVREMSNKFTIVTMSYEKSGRTLNGTDPLSALITLESLGASAVGANCSSGPVDMKKVILKMKDYARVPIVAKPNAGMPKMIANKTVFDMSEDRFAKAGKSLVLSGVSIIGGCCGTEPKHIEALKREFKEELNINIEIKDFICQVIYDYPQMKVKAKSYYVEYDETQKLKKLVHEEIKWVKKEELLKNDMVGADIEIIKKILEK